MFLCYIPILLLRISKDFQSPSHISLFFCFISFILRSVKYRALARHFTPLPTHIVQPDGSTMCLNLPLKHHSFSFLEPERPEGAEAWPRRRPGSASRIYNQAAQKAAGSPNQHFMADAGDEPSQLTHVPAELHFAGGAYGKRCYEADSLHRRSFEG